MVDLSKLKELAIHSDNLDSETAELEKAYAKKDGAKFEKHKKNIFKLKEKIDKILTWT